MLTWGCLGLAGCRGMEGRPPGEGGAETQVEGLLEIVASFDARLRTRSDSLDELLLPAPFLTPAQEAELRRYPQLEHLERARRLGVRPTDSIPLERLVSEGRLVELSDTTDLWIVRRLDYSAPFVTPATRALLDEVAERFRLRLERMGLPAFRLEVTSALRTPEEQETLRGRNPNAAPGTSSHEFGTSVDVAYSGFTAPVDPLVDVSVPGEPWLESHFRRVAAGAAERLAARRSGELKAILGGVLDEMQREGRVLVILEDQQPAYHLTLGRDEAEERSERGG